MPDLPPYPGAPRWVKVSGVIGGVLVLSLVIMFLAGGGHHGPGRHAPPASVAEPGLKQP